jgi:cysteine synthase A
MDAPSPLPGVHASVLGAVGRTPIVELSRLVRAAGAAGRIVAKLDYLNPAGSKKDLVALGMIEDALREGLLKPGQTVVEVTSGNTGNGLAMVCAVMGHPFVAIMSRGNSEERATISRAFGAEVILVDQAPGSAPGKVGGADLALVEAAARRVIEERGAFRVDQFNRPSNARVHYERSGPDLIRATGGAIDGFCDLAGTGGSFAGIARALKERNPAVRCYLVEPSGVETLAGCLVTCGGGHALQGAGYGRENLALLDRKLVDGYLAVDDATALETTRELARREGVLAGPTSGANVAAALQLLHGPLAGRTVAVSLPDSGMKYFSTGLWPRA